MLVKERPVSLSERADRASRISWRLLWWLPLSPLVGFTAANWLLADPWPLWQVVPLAVILAVPFALGAYHGLRAFHLGDLHAWIPIALHAAFAVIALVMPIAEALTG